jgi:hypothetical protein
VADNDERKPVGLDFTADIRLLWSLSIDEIGSVLEQKFGERPARSAVSDYMFPPTRPYVEYGTGRIIRPIAALAVATAPSIKLVAHSFFGDYW